MWSITCKAPNSQHQYSTWSETSHTHDKEAVSDANPTMINTVPMTSNCLRDSIVRGTLLPSSGGKAHAPTIVKIA